MQVVFSNLIVVVFIVEKIYVYKKSVASIRDYQLFRYTASSYIQGYRSLLESIQSYHKGALNHL